MLRFGTSILALHLALLAPAIGAAQPVEVASGADLGDWQALETQRLRGDEAVDAYRAYVIDYPTSPLAVAAYGRLVALDAAAPWGDDTTQRVVADVAARWAASQHTAPATDDAVVWIELDPPAPSRGGVKVAALP